jgi:8-oxo-dGTP pyrophosphatase MutT (NUDIX family)
VSEPVTEKVLAYITQGDNLLVFSHPHEPDAGIQIPGGTVEPGEAIDAAVLREAQEETGLEGLGIHAYLGEEWVNLADYGLAGGILRRHFYHLVFDGQTPARWRHFEEHPSEGPPDPIEFELYWVRFPDEVPELSGRQGAMLHLIRWEHSEVLPGGYPFANIER